MFDIFCVTDRSLCKGDFLSRLDMIAGCVSGGIILREKTLSEEEYTQLAAKALKICAAHGSECILHNFHSAAAALGGDKIHLPLPVLRSLTAEEKANFRLIGASCHSVEEAREAQALGCGYITAGHIFSTDCKRGVPPRGLEFLEEVCGSVSIPVYAIGGIGKENIRKIKSTHAAGACIMSGFMVCESGEKFMEELGG